VLSLAANIYHLNIHWAGYFFAPHPVTRKRRFWKVLAWYSAAIMVFIIAFSAYGYFIPESKVFGTVYSQGTEKTKLVALTFDDGPNEPYTSQILDVLKANDINATFFVIGKNVELYPDVARRIMAEGNVIGNHSYSHNANHALSDYGVRDMETAETVIDKITGVMPHLYRPPHGKKSPWELASMKRNDMIEITWDASANDQHDFAFFGKPTATEYAHRIVEDVHPGSIIAMHDGFGTQHNTKQSNQTLTVQALKLVIQQLKAKGYSFVTVPALLHVPAYNNTASQ
jgi:peptidoglycan/xylan/chitin deacetylase (PgdA/CDA1 family)